MASVPSDLDPDAETERVAALEAALERSEQRREAAEQWATFLERELEARDRRLDSVIEQYERQLAAAQERAESGADGAWTRLKRWLRRRR